MQCIGPRYCGTALTERLLCRQGQGMRLSPFRQKPLQNAQPKQQQPSCCEGAQQHATSMHAERNIADRWSYHHAMNGALDNQVPDRTPD